MITKKNLKKKLRSPDNKVVLLAVENLRANGWLEDGTLAGINLQFAHLQRVDLYNANLQKANLANTDLRGAVLTKTDLSRAVLTKANVLRADLCQANIRGTRFVGANLQGVLGLTDEQLAEADALWNATMPDGSRYDGRFNLPGDIQLARSQGCNMKNSREREKFYALGENSPRVDDLPKLQSSLSDQQVYRKLYSSDNKVVLAAVNELRKREKLFDGSMEWKHLKYVQMQGANLSDARLSKANLSMSQLSWANLTGAYLKGTILTKSNLEQAVFHQTYLQGASLAKSNLYSAKGITEEQLCSLSRLRGARLPDGKRYDGRYKLAGDLWDAEYLRFDINDPHSMADFYGIITEDFMLGQMWAQEHLGGFWIKTGYQQERVVAETIVDTLVGLYD